jgi:hypothetical protein
MTTTTYSDILCQINDVGFSTKPTDIRFMGQLRDKMIQKPWDYLTERRFIEKITTGHAFYGCIFDGHDLLEYADGRQRQCWRAQSIIAVDIDHCPIHPQDMAKFYTDLGYLPWIAYKTFSNGQDGLYSYRLMWRVEVNPNVSYEQWHAVIKGLSGLTEYGDKRAMDPSRMWQGSHNSLSWKVPGLIWRYEEFVNKLGLS